MTKKLYFWAGLTPIIVSIVLSLIILLFFKFLPPKLPLFYSLPWGEKQLVEHQQFFIIPGILILITLLNFIISWNLHVSQIFFKKILIMSIFVSTIILVITFIKIILIFI